MIWNIDPEILRIGPLAFRWYGLFFATAFIAGFWIMQWIYGKEGRSTEELESLFTYMFVGTVIGARLGHCIFYEPMYYLRNPLDILKIWEGGLASHGGAIGIVLALFLYSKKAGMPDLLWILDRIVIPTALGGSYIRVGNFFNSEILGIQTKGWWAVIFERVDMVPRHPVQIYEALAYMAIFWILFFFYRIKKCSERRGFLSGLFLALAFSARFALEFFKTEQAAYDPGFAISVGQCLSVPFALAGLYMIVRSLKKKS